MREKEKEKSENLGYMKSRREQGVNCTATIPVLVKIERDRKPMMSIEKNTNKIVTLPCPTKTLYFWKKKI